MDCCALRRGEGDHREADLWGDLEHTEGQLGFFLNLLTPCTDTSWCQLQRRVGWMSVAAHSDKLGTKPQDADLRRVAAPSAPCSSLQRRYRE